MCQHQACARVRHISKTNQGAYIMTGKNFVSQVVLAAVFFATLTPRRALGGSAAIGTIAGGLHATVGGEAIQPNTVVFSGDSLRVADGAAVVAMKTGSRVILGQRTAASFLQGSDEVIVVLEQGNVSMYHPASATPLCVRLGALSVGSVRGFNTRGDVAMLDGVVVVTAKEGELRLEKNGSTMEVRKGQTITFGRSRGAATARRRFVEPLDVGRFKRRGSRHDLWSRGVHEQQRREQHGESSHYSLCGCSVRSHDRRRGGANGGEYRCRG